MYFYEATKTFIAPACVVKDKKVLLIILILKVHGTSTELQLLLIFHFYCNYMRWELKFLIMSLRRVIIHVNIFITTAIFSYVCTYLLYFLKAMNFKYWHLYKDCKLIDAAYDAMTTHSYEIQYVMSSSKFNVKSSL